MGRQNKNKKGYKKSREFSEEEALFYDELLFKKAKEQQKRKCDLDRQHKQKHNYNRNGRDSEDED